MSTLITVCIFLGVLVAFAEYIRLLEKCRKLEQQVDQLVREKKLSHRAAKG